MAYEGSEVATMAGAAREAGEYAPFRSGATTPPASEQAEEVSVLERPDATPEQVWRRAVSMLERLSKSLDKNTLKAFENQPEKLQKRFANALGEIQDKVSEFV